MALESSRVDRRRRERHTRILALAARRFAAEGPDGVRLDEIADQADIARGTLYSHFATKEALIAAVVRPALEQAIRAFGGLVDLPPRQAVDGLLRAYVTLWQHHGDALRVAHQVGGIKLGELERLHQRVMGLVLEVLTKASRARLLRSGDPRLGALAIARLAVPLLELCQSHDSDGSLFIESMAGLLLRPARLDSRARKRPSQPGSGRHSS